LQNAVSRAELQYNAKIRDAEQQLKGDQQVVRNAVGGSLTKGEPVTSMEALQAIPQLKPIIERVHREQSDFYDTIPTMIAKRSDKTSTQNSPNGYEALIHVGAQSSDPMGDTSASENYLHEHMGRNDQTGITYKDYQDGLAFAKEDAGFKMVVTQTMKEIAENNGNIDGGGEARAIDFFHRAMDMKKNLSADQKAADELSNVESKNYIGNMAKNYMPSRETMMSKSAQKSREQPETNQPTNEPIAINPKTGAKVVYRNGAWQPM
jgi:hypothetical protein